jgi:hypothetical protein
MRLTSAKGWLLTLALVTGIATFTATNAVYADDHGCKETTEPCGEGGTCGFLHINDGDFCVCHEGGDLTATCQCSLLEPCEGEG